MFFLIISLLTLSHSWGQDVNLDLAQAANDFNAIFSNRLEKIKEGSRPFIMLHDKKGPTVLMFHGLSDSPGSMKEVANIYFKHGYNVLTVLLRDHGLLSDYRRDIRDQITLQNWREDIDQYMKVALSLSDSNKISLIGFSLGGALILDTTHRYEGKINSLVFLAPLFKMNHEWAIPASKFLRHVLYSTSKGIKETAHFYPNITLNQTYQAYKLTKYIKKNITQEPTSELLAIPKLMFLTDADSTIENKYAYKVAELLQLDSNQIVTYTNDQQETTVLHRDLPMRFINASGAMNPHIDDLLKRLDNFLAAHDR